MLAAQAISRSAVLLALARSIEHWFGIWQAKGGRSSSPAIS
jgi:hypothetical protein